MRVRIVVVIAAWPPLDALKHSLRKPVHKDGRVDQCDSIAEFYSTRAKGSALRTKLASGARDWIVDTERWEGGGFGGGIVKHGVAGLKGIDVRPHAVKGVPLRVSRLGRPANGVVRRRCGEVMVRASRRLIMMGGRPHRGEERVQGRDRPERSRRRDCHLLASPPYPY